jgi:haloalkane dehalogenase
VSGITAFQRRTPAAMMGRVSGVLRLALTVPQAASIGIGAVLITVVDYRVLLVVIAVTAAASSLLVIGQPGIHRRAGPATARLWFGGSVPVETAMIEVLDTRLCVRRVPGRPGARPVVLLHGNPTSSHLWRHVLSAAGEAARADEWIAPDLAGMGSSGKPDSRYRLVDHLAYVDALLDALALTDVVLVGHDWGVTIALDWARRHPERVRGVAIMEGHVRPLPDWDAFDPGGGDLFQRLRTPGTGERMVLEENFFIDTLLPAGLLRALPDDELQPYRAPYPDPVSRRPLLRWAREIPVAGDPADVAARMRANAEFLAATHLPVLVLHGQPGVLVTPSALTWFREQVRNLTLIDTGGPVGHFLPEDRPAEVASALTTWVAQLR